LLRDQRDYSTLIKQQCPVFTHSSQLER